MQKNKCFQKTNKTCKLISSTSSRVLLQLSQITPHSKDQSALMQNFSQRSPHPCPIDFQTTQNNLNQTTKHKQKAKSNSKKQTYLRQKAPLSNSLITQIMQISNSLPIRNHQFESSKIIDKQNDLIIFSKTDLQKNKTFSQNKKSKKLLLFDNKQNYDRAKLKSKSSSSQIMKGEPILYSIKIHPLQQQKHNLSTNQKRQSFDGRRSSFSSRRSSITLLPQEDFVSESKIKQIKKSFLAKISLDDLNHKTPEDEATKMDNFLKKSHLNFYEENFSSQQLKANQSKQTQITPRQKKQIRETYLLKLDELNVIQDDIRKEASKFIPVWNRQIQSEKNLQKYYRTFEQVRQNSQKLQSESNQLKNMLFQENKRYIMSKKMSSNNLNSQKQSILFEVQKIHTQVKKKVFKKDLEEMMIFNMKVVLPSSQLMESSISCFESQINMGLNYSNISILQLYEELMNQRACKKYGMILKKEINNMNIYDNRTMNEYLKRLFQLQIAFNKVQGQDPQNLNVYFERIQHLLNQIQQTQIQLSHVQRNYSDLEKKIQQNQRLQKMSNSQLQFLLNDISEAVYGQYRLFQTGGNLLNKTCTESVINESFNASDKPITEFRDLVSRKYDELYHRFKQVKEEEKNVIDSLNHYQ